MELINKLLIKALPGTGPKATSVMKSKVPSQVTTNQSQKISQR